MDGSQEFAAWYAAEHPRVLGAACLVAGDVEVAREATDEAFVRALERWGRVSQLNRPGAWVTVTAVNLVKRSRHRRMLERRAARRAGPAVAVAPPSLPEEVWATVQQLPPRMRVAVALRYVGDLSEGAIAEAMGTSVGTVASTLHDARARLRVAMQARGETPRTPEVRSWTT